MVVLPAIDLVAGQVVRLAQGKREHMDVYSKDPAAVAAALKAAGATWIHVVDLSAAFEEDHAARAANAAALREVATVRGIKLDVGGGVRSLAAIEDKLNVGAARVAVGTALVRDASVREAAPREFGADAVVADVALEHGVVKVNGWREDAGLALEPFLRELHRLGWRHLVATDVTKDGMQSGINTSFYQQVFEAFSAPVVASGGVATLADVAALAELAGRTGALEGVIIGRALYEGAFTLSEALAQVAHVTATARKDAEAGDGIVSPTAGPAAGSPTAGDQQLRGVSRHEAREEGGDAV